jgi:hypothetical protein
LFKKNPPLLGPNHQKFGRKFVRSNFHYQGKFELENFNPEEFLNPHQKMGLQISNLQITKKFGPTLQTCKMHIYGR